MDHDASHNHAARRQLLASFRKVASAAPAPAKGQGAASAHVSYFNATVDNVEANGGGNLYQLHHASGEVYRGVPIMQHVGTPGNGTVVSVRKVGNRMIIDGIPLGNADAFVGP